MMRVGSLFSGIGGIELGLERAGGFETEWFVENDAHAQAILRKHWPETPIYDDVTTLDFRNVPQIDVLTGGFPCQDISNAGKRAGITGNRSGLWKHYLRAISVLRPKLVVAENVAALTRRGLDVVLCDLAAIGYDAEWHCLPASAVGAPHRRDRIVILVYPNDSGHVHGQPTEQSDYRGGAAQYDSRKSSQDMADAKLYGCNVGEERGSIEKSENESRLLELKGCHKPSETLSENVSDAKSEGLERRGQRWRPTDSSQGCWENDPAESGMGRVADGVPHWMDRIKRLGNAVVPQWAEAIGRAINEASLTERF